MQELQVLFGISHFISLRSLILPYIMQALWAFLNPNHHGKKFLRLLILPIFFSTKNMKHIYWIIKILTKPT